MAGRLRWWLAHGRLGLLYRLCWRSLGWSHAAAGGNSHLRLRDCRLGRLGGSCRGPQVGLDWRRGPGGGCLGRGCGGALGVSDNLGRGLLRYYRLGTGSLRLRLLGHRDRRAGLRPSGLRFGGLGFRHHDRLRRWRRLQQPVAVGSPPHPVGLGLDDARGMRLDSDAERDAKIKRLLICQPELLGELVDADLAWQRVPPFRESGWRDRPARDRSPGPTATLVEA